MSKIVVIDNPFVTLWYHPDKKIVHHKIHKFIHGPEFRECLTAGTRLIAMHAATKWLSDDRDNTVLTPEDGEWARESWNARTIALGWKHWAVVKPKKVLGQMGMERAVKELSAQGLNTRFFSDPDEAMSWLEAL